MYSDQIYVDYNHHGVESDRIYVGLYSEDRIISKDDVLRHLRKLGFTKTVILTSTSEVMEEVPLMGEILHHTWEVRVL